MNTKSLLKVVSLFWVGIFCFGFVQNASAATLSISPSASAITSGQSVTVNIVLSTEGVNIEGVDIFSLHYNPAVLGVQDAISGTSGTQISPGTLLPVTVRNTVNTSTGVIQFSQLNIEDGSYNGTGTLASVTFVGLASGTSPLTIDYSSGSTTDSNVSDTAGVDRLSGATPGSITVGAQVTPSTKFSLNDKVQVSASTFLNIRATPSTSGVLLGTQANGALGTIIGGPTYADGFHWWQVNFDAGVDGWAAENFLVDYTPTPTPSPTTPPPSGDTTTPVISSVQEVQVKHKTGKVSWTTDEASTTQAEYGTTLNYGSSTSFDGILATSHTANLTNLNPGTTYNYRVKSIDAAGNLAVSTNYTFTTQARLAKPPKPGSLNFYDGSIILSWTAIDYELCESITIYRHTSSISTQDPSRLLATLPCSATGYTDIEVSAGETYHYAIFVIDDLGVASEPLIGSYEAPATSSSSSGGGGGSSPNNNTSPSPAEPGCMANYLFSSITGKPCQGTSLPDPGCVTGNIFSSLTGNKCTSWVLTGATPATTSNNTYVPSGNTAGIYFTKPTYTNDKATVMNLQTVLNASLGLSLKVDGIYGPNTLAAVKAFQAAQGLAVDGKIGDMTRAKLNLVSP